MKAKLSFISLIISIFLLNALSGSYSVANSVENKLEFVPWYFVKVGDTQQEYGYWDAGEGKMSNENETYPLRRELYKNIVDNNPNLEFIMHTGDQSLDGGEQDDWNRYHEDTKYVSDHNITIYSAAGNHEYYTYYDAPGDYGEADSDLSTYLANVELPGNEQYYSLDYGQVHIIFINNCQNSGSLRVSDEEKSWLELELQANSNKFVIMVHHRPLYSCTSGRVDDAQDARAILEALYIQYKVDLVLAGHDHYFYRTIRNGITHIVSGGGGGNLDADGDHSEWQSGDNYASCYNYCNVSVTETVVQITTFKFSYPANTTTVIDTCSIPISTNQTTSSAASTSSTTPTATPISILSGIIGLVTIHFYRKKH